MSLLHLHFLQMSGCVIRRHVIAPDRIRKHTPEKVKVGGGVVADLCKPKAGGHPQEHGCLAAHCQQCKGQQERGRDFNALQGFGPYKVHFLFLRMSPLKLWKQQMAAAAFCGLW